MKAGGKVLGKSKGDSVEVRAGQRVEARAVGVGEYVLGGGGRGSLSLSL